MYVCMYAYEKVCVCVYVCECVCDWVCVPECARVCVCIHTHTNLLKCIYTYIYMTCVCACECVGVCTNARESWIHSPRETHCAPQHRARASPALSRAWADRKSAIFGLHTV